MTMKNLSGFLLIAILLAIGFTSCKEDTSAPAVTTTAVTSVTASAAISGGNVTAEGTAPVTARGVCWGIVANPTVADSKTTDGTGPGSFTSNVTGLTAGTVYHLRAYATNADGTGYGDDVSFTTSFLVKKITFTAPWNGGLSGYEFFYDANKRVTHFNRTFDGAADGAFVYNYTVANKLTLTKDASAYASYDLNAQGNITKDDWGGGEYASWEYDANGFITKGYEYWSSTNHLKREVVITNGNVTKITKFADDGTTQTQVKTFTYTTGANINNIQQTNVIDSDWKPVGDFYGKASAKLIDYFEYWDPRVNPIVIKKATFAYTFDAKNRPATVTKTAADLTLEVWTYTYYE
jgi:hypothetical protein